MVRSRPPGRPINLMPASAAMSATTVPPETMAAAGMSAVTARVMASSMAVRRVRATFVRGGDSINASIDVGSRLLTLPPLGKFIGNQPGVLLSHASRLSFGL